MPSGGPSRTRSCFREVVGRPVVDLSTGAEMGVVRDCLFDEAESRLVGVRVSEGLLAHREWNVDFDAIRSLGYDAVTVDSPSALVPRRDDEPDSESPSRSTVSILGKRVMSEGGRDIGLIKDAVVDAETGLIVGYEVSESVLQDILAGRLTIPQGDLLTVGEETVVIPDDIGAPEID